MLTVDLATSLKTLNYDITFNKAEKFGTLYHHDSQITYAHGLSNSRRQNLIII